MNAASAKVVPKASLKVGFFSRADRTLEDSMRCRILRAESRSTPHREATCDDDLLRGWARLPGKRHECTRFPQGKRGQKHTCTATMASPVSRTNVLEKTLTARPERKPAHGYLHVRIHSDFSPRQVK